MADLINVKGMKELGEFLTQLPDKLQNNVMRGVLRAGAVVLQQEVIANVPVKSGVLKKGIKVSTRARRGIVKASVKATGKHAHIAHWLEYGVTAHVIKPRRKKSLVFGNLLVKGVNHPGFKPKPFMRPAADMRAQQAVQAMAKQLKARLTKAGLSGAAEVDTDE